MDPQSFDDILNRFGTERRINYGLERLRMALLAVGSPETRLKSFLVGGTNGKGTVALLLSNGLRESGYSVATFLSPHLESARERFLDNLTPAPDGELAALAQEFVALGQKYELSYFEFLTLLFVVWAERRRFDFAIIEVGLGGRLDSTNLTAPLASLITNVSYDHQEYLGRDLNAILSEKLGIVRRESLLFTGVSLPELKAQVIKACDDVDAIYYFSSEMKAEVTQRDWSGQTFTLNGYPFRITNPSPGAVENTALAFLFFRIVFPAIALETLQNAFSKTRNPGRLEIIQTSPRVILSGDHNPAGVADLIALLKVTGTDQVRILCGFSGDKPYAELVNQLRQLTPHVTVVPVNGARVLAAADYRSLPGYRDNALQVLDETIASASPTDTIIVTGSLYLVGELRARWQKPLHFRE